MQNDSACGQLDILFHHTDCSLKTHLEEHVGRPVSLVLTENSTRMLSARVQTGALHIRLHRMFLKADTSVISEIVSYLKFRKAAMPFFRKFIRDNRDELGRKSPKKVPVRTAGTLYDLRELYDEVNREYFGGLINAAITWGTRSPRTAVRKRTVGSYSVRTNIIRINPVLDRKTVPRYYIAFIVYHEMLHAAQGIALQGKRRSIHPREFRRKEKLFKDYEKAIAWEGRT
jgi:predicted metal-dependent hydrolase